MFSEGRKPWYLRNAPNALSPVRATQGECRPYRALKFFCDLCPGLTPFAKHLSPCGLGTASKLDRIAGSLLRLKFIQ
jgi:hypothetical protein